MKISPRHVAGAVVAMAVQALFSAHALTLAEVDARVVVGQPFEAKVHVRSIAQEDVSDACISAQVSYGDIVQSGVQVNVLAQAGDAGTKTLRVQTRTVVNEPVVTLLLRSTCGTTSERSYVLLSEFPTSANLSKQVASPAPIASQLPVVVLPAPAASASAPALVAPALTPAEGKRAVARKAKVATAVAGKAQPQARAASAPARTTKAAVNHKLHKPERMAARAVLKLDPLELFSDRLDAIDASPLFEPAPEALLQVQKLAALEQDVKALRLLAQASNAKLSDLRLQLQQAQAQQTPALLTYSIGVLLLTCCAVLGWLLWRQGQLGRRQKGTDWWQELDALDVSGATAQDIAAPFKSAGAPVAPMPAATEPQPVLAPVLAKSSAPRDPAPAPVDLDIDLDQVQPEPELHGSFEFNTDSAPFEVNSVRHISVEPILDIRQQAEFFVSLGQSERALAILKKQILESQEPNPLVYLDLITLYHTLGLKKDFRDCSDAFHILFNGVVPAFPAFNLPSRSLEDYPQVVARLETLWPGHDALVFLSACIFHDTHVQPRQTFELEAFRDLLMLHAMSEMLAPPASMPLTAETAPTANYGALDAARPPPAEGVALLDIDFSDTRPQANQPQA